MNPSVKTTLRNIMTDLRWVLTQVVCNTGPTNLLNLYYISPELCKYRLLETASITGVFIKRFSICNKNKALHMLVLISMLAIPYAQTHNQLEIEATTSPEMSPRKVLNAFDINLITVALTLIR